ncbi:MAG: hypothetical protein QOH36_1942 [Actinomycetota bacterium]|nr:hypothetical protein [Actinomycetota bacterium]MEA2973072.1 hypothetical protein [Actinomycetota bacterium]
MRRTYWIAAWAMALCASLLSAGPVRGQTSPPTTDLAQRLRDERRGMVYDGLRQRPAGPCGDAFEIVEDGVTGRTRCTHGPDPAPDGVDVRVHRDFGAAATPQPGVAAAQAGIPCYGTGSDGYRVQLLYVRRSGTTDKLATYLPTFVNAAANANTTYRDSAAKTGGVRNIRYVTDASCDLVIQKVEVSISALGNLTTMVNELVNKGFTRTDRKYLAYVDANTYCGIGEIYKDDRPNAVPGQSSSNYANANPGVRTTFARVDNGCWNQSDSVEAHELTHMLGGVQPTAPRGTAGFHCRDESDRMCYVDAAGVVMTQVCAASNERLLDCNGNDYFNTAPPAGSWLATHWNVANSAFLAPSDPGAPPPPPPPPPPTTTTSTTKAPTTTTPTTTAPTTTTPTTAPPTTSGPTTTAPSGTPSAPRSLAAYRFSGIWLMWTAPVTGPVTGYNVYRKTASTAFAKIADIGATTSYSDSSGTVGVTYTYAVSAENGTREGPLSNQVNVTR